MTISNDLDRLLIVAQAWGYCPHEDLINRTADQKVASLMHQDFWKAIARAGGVGSIKDNEDIKESLRELDDILLGQAGEDMKTGWFSLARGMTSAVLCLNQTLIQSFSEAILFRVAKANFDPSHDQR